MQARARRFAVAPAVIAMALSPAAGGQAAPSEPTLEQRIERLCEDLDQRRADLRISALSLAVVKDDEVILARGFGLRDREQGLAADEHTLYAIGSTTKAFTSMLCAMLADEGLLSFSDRPARHLPWFKFKDPTANAAATLRDLLQHRTGLTRTDLAWFGTETTREDLLRLIAETETNAPFRAAWQYNNAMYLCAGECAAAAAGKSWDELIASRIFAPLAMTRSVTTEAGALADPRRALGYGWNDSKKEFERAEWVGLDNVAPAGSIFSTVVDMAQWVRFLLNRGEIDGKRLVSDAQFDELWRDGFTDSFPRYGLGWMLHEDDNQSWNGPDGKRRLVIEHGGNVPGYAAAVGLLPDHRLGLVLLTNIGATQLQSGILPMVFNALLGPFKERRPIVEGPALAAAETESWLGAYDERIGSAGLDLGLRRVLTRTDDHLVLMIPASPGQQSDSFFTILWPGEDGRAWLREDPDSFVRFERDPAGGLVALTLVQGDHERRMTRVTGRDDSKPPDLSIDELMAARNEATGFEAVGGWSSIRLAGTMRMPQSGVRGSWTLSAQGRDRLRVEFDAGKFGRSLTILDGERGTIEARFGGTPELPADALAVLRHANPLLELGWWPDDAEEVEIEEITGITALGMPVPASYAVRVKPHGAPPIRYYVAVADHRLAAVEGATAFPGLVQGSVPLALLDDVRDVEGVKMAFRRSVSVPQVGRIEIQVESAEVDVQLDDALFELPESAARAAAGGS